MVKEATSNSNNGISEVEAAKLLGISLGDIKILEKQEILKPIKHEGKIAYYSSRNIERIKLNKGLTISEEAEQIGVKLQQDIAASLQFIKKILFISGAGIAGYYFLIAIFAILFILFPLQTAGWLGYGEKAKNIISQGHEDPNSKVLAAATSILPLQNSPLQAILQPVGNISLGIVKTVSPKSYAQVASVTVVNTNDVLVPDQNGAITPLKPIKFSDSSLLQIDTNKLVTNLNSQYLQGKQPGANPGDIAIVGDISAPTPTPALTITTPVISGLTNANLSGNAGITNANLANSALTVDTSGPLSGGGSVSLGEKLTLSCPTCITASQILFTTDSSDTLTNKSLSGLTNTFTNISNSALANPSLTVSAGSGLSSGGLVSLGGTVTLAMPNVGTPGTYGSALNIPVLTTDPQGRITGVTNTAIAGLTISNFGSANISQWTNNSGYITASSADVLSSKIITAGSNTISGLTNNNLSGIAGITNANLANSSISLNGNSGSGSVALGGTLTLTGAGITNVTTTGSALTLTSTEADTLQSVFNRGNTIPTTSGSPVNAIDQATINIGSIASTAQQNFSTLNLSNGGTGYLDVELIKGFINFQGMNQFYDDFTEKSLDTTNKWTANPTGSGSSCSLLAGGLNGLLRMSAGGAASRRCEMSTQSTLTNGYYQRGNNPIFETKLKIDVTTNVRIFAGFTNTAPTAGSDTNASTHHAYIEKLASGTQFQCVTDNGTATETTTSTGVTMSANTLYRLRVELRSGSTPETICTIDDGTTVTRTVVTATQPGATSAMDIYLKVENSNSTIKNMDVDYVRSWQDDPSGEMLASNPDITTTIEATTDAKIVSNDEKNLITDTISNLFKNLVEFFGNVIFHTDVTFLGRPIFNKDTAGHAFVKAGENEINVVFEKEYKNNPIVTASVNLTQEVKPDEIPEFAVYDVSTKGFKIKLSKEIAFDLNFSWIALYVNGDNISISNSSITPSLSPVPTTIPSPTSSPSQEIIPSPTPLDEVSSSTSAQVVH